MKDVSIDVAAGDGMEIRVPHRSKARLRCQVVCLCCERADQPMDDDGCGICDTCLGLPASPMDDPERPNVGAHP